MMSPPPELTGQDVVEIAIGSAALAFPVAASEDIWNLSTELATVRLLAIGLTSMIVVAIFVLVVYRRDDGLPCGKDFWHRVGAVNAATLLVLAGILLMLDRLPLFTSRIFPRRSTGLCSWHFRPASAAP